MFVDYKTLREFDERITMLETKVAVALSDVGRNPDTLQPLTQTPQPKQRTVLKESIEPQEQPIEASSEGIAARSLDELKQKSEEIKKAMSEKGGEIE